MVSAFRQEGLIMPKTPHTVDVVEANAPTQGHGIRFEIGRNLNFDTAALQTYCLADWDARVYDAIVVAAAIQFCDHTKARRSTDWGRDFSLRIPVHDPEHWGSPPVSATLHDALTLLTGDRWNIEFLSRNTSAATCHQKNFTIPNSSGVIIPFSDGLDSYAVAGLMRRKYGHNLIPVRLGSAPLPRHATPCPCPPFASVPYHVSYGDHRHAETSSRSRGFRFALLSAIAAYLSKARVILVPESGQGALGHSLVTVGQAHPDYRNHPLFTDRMAAFVSALFGHEVDFVYPRLLHTKGETLTAFLDYFPDDRGWMQTRSCWQDARRISVSGQRRQCGICAACLLRRMSVHASGRSENPDTYIWEDLSAPTYSDGANTAFQNRQAKGSLYQYAIAGVLHLDHLADLPHSAVNAPAVNRQVFLLSRSIGFGGNDIRGNLERMLRRHREEWKSFIDSLGPWSFLTKWVTGA